MFTQAIPYYQQAGFMAAGVYANADAIVLFTRALTLLSHWPPGPKRNHATHAFGLAVPCGIVASTGVGGP